MAYARHGSTSAEMPMGNDSEDNEVEKGPGKRKTDIILFGFNLSTYSPTVQYSILTMNLLFFMCSYGYFQGTVINNTYTAL